MIMDEKVDVKEERIRRIAPSYYIRKEVASYILKFSEDREVVPRYFEGFGKRPDILQYESDITEFVKKGATSFHCSEELWEDVLQIATGMSREKLDELRKGWDFLIDIDSKYLDYSKITAKLILEALEFHGIKNYGLKFSGNKGFHIIVPWKAFPGEVNGILTKNMFPEWPRLMVEHLNDFIREKLIDEIGKITSENLKGEGIKKYIKGEEKVGDAVSKVMPDLILVSPRHLFRMPYSLHEISGLSSVVLSKEQLDNFSLKDADPLKLNVKEFYKNPRKDEAKELLLQALDWQKREPRKIVKAEEKGERASKDFQGKEFIIKNKSSLKYPPCIKKILSEGMADGKKRALFILLNFFKSLKFENDEIKKIISDWNSKNNPPLGESYISGQFSWHFSNKQKSVLPPNCNKQNYKDIGICDPDDFCKLIKNPINYTIKKIFSGSKKKNKNSNN
jgi:hypothetical protein